MCIYRELNWCIYVWLILALHIIKKQLLPMIQVNHKYPKYLDNSTWTNSKTLNFIYLLWLYRKLIELVDAFLKGLMLWFYGQGWWRKAPTISGWPLPCHMPALILNLGHSANKRDTYLCVVRWTNIEDQSQDVAFGQCVILFATHPADLSYNNGL